MEVLTKAEQLADDVFFPSALATDRERVVPAPLLDALADAGLYGLTGPASAGGLDADFPTVCGVVELLSSGCLTTTFVWAQHLGAVLAVASSENVAVRELLTSLCRGELRAGLALGGALPGPPQLVARETPDGWELDGVSPFVSGWERLHLVHTAARTDDERLVWSLVDARETEALSAERLELVALNATATVRARFRNFRVPRDRVTSVVPYEEGTAPPPELLRIHASFALGVTARCCRLLDASPLDEELSRCRQELDRLDPATIEAMRASAGELALRAAAALVAAGGSRSLLHVEHAQRLAREALFALVYALRPASRRALLNQLGAA